MHLANAYGHEAGIAEYVIGTMLALTRSFGRIDARLRKGEWESQWAVGIPSTSALAGACRQDVGHSWLRAYRRGSGPTRVGVRHEVCAIRRQAQVPTPQSVSFVGGPDRLDEVLRQSDYLAITLSLSPETRGLLDAKRLGLMKPTAHLINVARAEIVDETALYRCAFNRRPRRCRARCLVSLSDGRWRRDFRQRSPSMI